MITKEELQNLLTSTETYRLERTISTNNMDKFSEAICAFANDMPNSRKNGYLIIGAYDDGKLSGLNVDDALLKRISAIRSDGNILPLPVMNVEKFKFKEGDLLVAEITPSFQPPVRYRGRTFIRIGPRRDIASEAEERILTERRIAYMATFDAMPCFQACIDDIQVDKIKQFYLPKAISKEVLDSDTRDIKEQMASLALYDIQNDCPTYAAVVLFGKNPKRFLPGCYIQFVRFNGTERTKEIDDERRFEQCYFDMLPQLETFVEMSIIKRHPVAVSTLREETVFNYPFWAVRELLMNATMHRDLQSNTPLRFYEYSNRLEIMNPGGLYGNARPENFPKINDYRNPIIAEAMKVLGYVNMFNRGVNQVMTILKDNGNSEAIFNLNLITAFEVVVETSSDKNFLFRFNSDKREEIELEKGLSQTLKGTKSNVNIELKGTKSSVKMEQVRNKKGLSRIERGTKSDTVMSRLIEYCTTPKSMQEIAEFLGYKNRTKLKQNYINPLLGKSLNMTIPDKPKSRLQKYVTIGG